jgi:hypothetical protein
VLLREEGDVCSMVLACIRSASERLWEERKGLGVLPGSTCEQKGDLTAEPGGLVSGVRQPSQGGELCPFCASTYLRGGQIRRWVGSGRGMVVINRKNVGGWNSIVGEL